ncbi:MAG: trehalose-phosphatase [Lamprobacter sp.]|uniref:trehalose-phosphatase n=1 Tax=Lamprobacter sp. TaxID=3100796 RepID=UPI002B261B33|nr:trehalose-phosphatase [Lamprobacter sp.]MEA3640594.1 trehalose-phosphatase [Lamprobacter sp.]
MPDAQPVFSREQLDAVLFDLDGVITRTAEIHAEAWKRLFDAYLNERPAAAGEDHSPFDETRDYRRYVDGRPRVKGVKHFLLARGIDLPDGEPNDPPERETLYGLGDICGPQLRLELPEGIDALNDLDRAATDLDERLENVDGVRIERKRFAVTVHVRQVSDADLPQVQEAVDQARRRADGLRKTGGKRVVELRPDVDWDKGRAVRWLLSELKLDGPDVLPLYLGDDETDEDAFRALRQMGGIGILVAEDARPSAADYRLRTPDEVEALLRHLTEIADGDRAP